MKERLCHLQKLRARRLSALIVGLAPPRIAKSAQDASGACDIEDDDLHEESQTPQQLQQQHALNGGKPQHGSATSVQKFTGSKAAAAGRMAAAAASAAAAPAAGGSGLTGARASASAACSNAGMQAQQADGAPHHGAGAAAHGVAPAAAPEQGVVAQDSLNDGQATAVRRCLYLMYYEQLQTLTRCHCRKQDGAKLKLMQRSASVQDTDGAGLCAGAGDARHRQDGCHLCRRAQPAGRQEDSARHVIHEQVLPVDGI